MSRYTISNIKQKFTKQEKLVVVAAYTKSMAELADQYSDMILVGDSLGMVLYGMESTLPVDMNLMINHGKAVVNFTSKSLIIVDMPFGSYQVSKEETFKNAAKIMKRTGANAVKLEGGVEFQESIEFLTKRGIAVMGHVGLLPQSVNQLGGYKFQGKDKKSEAQIIKDAVAIEAAGAFAIVVEGVKKEVVAKLKKKINIPLIGIGAAKECDGQVLVANDLLGMSENVAKFVKKYANLREDIDSAFKQYASEVRAKKFPESKHTY